jgi:hypothetical protein
MIENQCVNKELASVKERPCEIFILGLNFLTEVVKFSTLKIMSSLSFKINGQHY